MELGWNILYSIFTFTLFKKKNGVGMEMFSASKISTIVARSVKRNSEVQTSTTEKRLINLL